MNAFNINGQPGQSVVESCPKGIQPNHSDEHHTQDGCKRKGARMSYFYFYQRSGSAANAEQMLPSGESKSPSVVKIHSSEKGTYKGFFQLPNGFNYVTNTAHQ